MRGIATIALLLLATVAAIGQSFIYDQQSATESTKTDGYAGLDKQPLGQSFTPSLTAVGFVRIFVSDPTAGLSGGTTLAINLRSNSITGTILGTTIPVSLATNSPAFNDFFFSSAIPVTPGVTYYFQPVVQSGSFAWDVNQSYKYGYSGGTVFVNGAADSTSDMWFREGLVVPEPSVVWLVLAGGAGLFFTRRKKFRANPARGR